jgi:NAD-dependent SIR2 family protein deacetylase
MALSVKPNPAHYALAALARKRPDFLTLSQNVDGLSPRADHLFEVKCSSRKCGYTEENYTDPIVPSLDLPSTNQDVTSNSSRSLGSGKVDISDASVQLVDIPKKDLPTCPACEKALLRPDVVWFGEALPEDVIDDVREYMDRPEGIDLILVIGTGAKVYPAAGYIQEARGKGARVCVVNMGEFWGNSLQVGEDGVLTMR